MQREHEMQQGGPEGARTGFFASRGNIVLIGFLAIAEFYLMTEHTAHLLGALPYLLFLACPLMHVFMHGSHGGHGGRSSTDANGRSSSGDQGGG